MSFKPPSSVSNTDNSSRMVNTSKLYERAYPGNMRVTSANESHKKNKTRSRQHLNQLQQSSSMPKPHLQQEPVEVANNLDRVPEVTSDPSHTLSTSRDPVSGRLMRPLIPSSPLSGKKVEK